MRFRNTLILALVTCAPLTAWAQGGDDEFYQSPDAGDAALDESGAEADVSVTEEVETEGDQLPFRGSTFTYENIFSAATAGDLSPETSFYYAMSYSLRPRYYLNDWFNFRLRLDLEHELTDSPTTTRLREPLLSDMWLDFYFSDVLESVTDTIDLSTYLRLQLPTSKVSQARTLVMGGTVGVVAQYTAPVLEGLRLTYGINGTKYFNQRTTSAFEEPLVAMTPNTQALAESYLGPGTRNASWLLRNTIGVDLMPIEDLTLSVSVTFYDYFLYPVSDMTTEDLEVDVACGDAAGCVIDSDPNNTNRRSNIWYIVELSYSPVPWLGLALGTSTYNPQLTPGSEYRAPFFNRFTNVYFDISVTIDELVNSIRNRRSGGSVASRPADEV